MIATKIPDDNLTTSILLPQRAIAGIADDHLRPLGYALRSLGCLDDLCERCQLLRRQIG